MCILGMHFYQQTILQGKMGCYNSCLWTWTLNIISTNSILNRVIVDFVIGAKLRPNKHFGMEQHLNHWFPTLSHTVQKIEVMLSFVFMVIWHRKQQSGLFKVLCSRCMFMLLNLAPNSFCTNVHSACNSQLKPQPFDLYQIRGTKLIYCFGAISP